MPSPFPGMDPYLEAPDIWPDFHNRFATEISSTLNAALPSPYYAQLESRPELGILKEGARWHRVIPDVTVVPHSRPREAGGGVAVVEQPRVEVSPPIEVNVSAEPLRYMFIEIRDSKSEHISLIEILSPSNKRKGPDRDAYAREQREILESDANLIGIDLLRRGERIYPTLDLDGVIRQIEPPPLYLVLVNRSWQRIADCLGYQLFPFGLREWLPCIPVPLREPEADVPLDLQYVFQRIYDTGPYRRGAVDYSQPPEPPLSSEDAAWAEGLVRQV